MEKIGQIWISKNRTKNIWTEPLLNFIKRLCDNHWITREYTVLKFQFVTTQQGFSLDFWQNNAWVCLCSCLLEDVWVQSPTHFSLYSIFSKLARFQDGCQNCARMYWHLTQAVYLYSRNFLVVGKRCLWCRVGFPQSLKTTTLIVPEAFCDATWWLNVQNSSSKHSMLLQLRQRKKYIEFFRYGKYFWQQISLTAEDLHYLRNKTHFFQMLLPPVRQLWSELADFQISWQPCSWNGRLPSQILWHAESKIPRKVWLFPLHELQKSECQL